MSRNSYVTRDPISSIKKNFRLQNIPRYPRHGPKKGAGGLIERCNKNYRMAFRKFLANRPPLQQSIADLNITTPTASA